MIWCPTFLKRLVSYTFWTRWNSHHSPLDQTPLSVSKWHLHYLTIWDHHHHSCVTLIILYPHIWSIISCIDQSLQHKHRTTIIGNCKTQCITHRPIAGGLLVPESVYKQQRPYKNKADRNADKRHQYHDIAEPSYNVSRGLRTLLINSHICGIYRYILLLHGVLATYFNNKHQQTTINHQKSHNWWGTTCPDPSFSLVKSLFWSKRTRAAAQRFLGLVWPLIAPWSEIWPWVARPPAPPWARPAYPRWQVEMLQVPWGSPWGFSLWKMMGKSPNWRWTKAEKIDWLIRF